jgi:hypothetical protein
MLVLKFFLRLISIILPVFSSLINKVIFVCNHKTQFLKKYKMKKLLLFSFIGFTVNANSQITITTADVVVPTKSLVQANDTMPVISVGSPGAGITWNMSSLNSHSLDTAVFRPYSAAPNPSFATSNLLLQQSNPDINVYLNNSASGLINLGFNGIIDFDSFTGRTTCNLPHYVH